jgi:lambda repressor-like predicted transcriptional regulator
MLPELDIAQAIFRGRFTVPVAWFQQNGLPADYKKYEQIVACATDLRLAIAEQVEAKHNYGVYVPRGTANKQPVFKADRFAALIDRLGIEHWPLTPSGHYSTDDRAAFEPMARLHPELEPLRQARKAINSLSRLKVTVSSDGRNRFSVFPFGGLTGRNQPKASQCILLRPKWMRGLLQPAPGKALIAVDIVAAEAALAAGFSNDPEAKRIYQSGADRYIEYAKAALAVPADATAQSHAKERALYKIALLAIQYGISAATLAQNLGIPLWHAERIIAAHKRTYATYWAWADAQVKQAQKDGHISTPFGWRMHVDSFTPRNRILNFPLQAGCADVLRVACLIAAESGLGPYLCAPLHDALYLECPVDAAEDVKTAIEECFVEAGLIVTDGAIRLRLDSKIITHPDRLTDKKSEAIWTLVDRYFLRKG